MQLLMGLNTSSEIDFSETIIPQRPLNLVREHGSPPAFIQPPLTIWFRRNLKTTFLIYPWDSQERMALQMRE